MFNLEELWWSHPCRSQSREVASNESLWNGGLRGFAAITLVPTTERR